MINEIIHINLETAEEHNKLFKCSVSPSVREQLDKHGEEQVKGP